MKQIKNLIDERFHEKRPKNLSSEFQVYGVYLCESLGDTNYPMYMRLAKRVDRQILDEALTFVKGYPAANSRVRLFLWKVKQLNQEKADKNRE